MMTPERDDEIEQQPGPEADPIRKAISAAIGAVFEFTDDETKRSLG
jgi:hypothetical protein